MWYETLPSLMIVGGLIMVPHGVTYLCNKFDCNGHPHRRNIFLPGGLAGWFRDQRLSGDPYVAQGLETISDELRSAPKKQ